MTISVLMSTYYREKPEYLDSAIKSIWTDQIRKPDEIILIRDGILTPGLDAVIDKWKDIIGSILVVIDNKTNKGLALSLNQGVEHAHGDLIARMDSDDISLPERFLIQEKYMAEHPEVEILGGALREFNDDDTINSIRYYPATMQEVKEKMHRMAPLGHPSVVFRRSFFDVGYRYESKYYLCEDVTLWFNAVCNNRIINNIPDIVLKFRRNDSMITRRRREKAWSEFCAYNDGIYDLCGLWTTKYIYSFLRLFFRLMPMCIIKSIYNNSYLRNKLS